MAVVFRDNSESVKDAARRAVVTALEMIGSTAEGYAKESCPVDTGRLRASISHAVQEDTVYVGTNVEYAPYIEFGTGRHATMGGGSLVTFDKKGNPHDYKGRVAVPFLKPAISEHTGEYEQMIKDILG